MQAEELLKIFGVQDGADIIANAAKSTDYQSPNEVLLSGSDSVGQVPNPHVGETELDREQVGDLIAASEARTDTKFARLEGKLDLILERFEANSAKSALQIQGIAEQEAAERGHVRSELSEIRGEYKRTRNTVIGTGLTVVLLVVAILTLYINALSTGAALASEHEFAVTGIDTMQSNRIAPPPTIKALPAPIQNKS